MVKVVISIQMGILIMEFGIKVRNLVKVLIIIWKLIQVILVFGIRIKDMVKVDINMVMVIDLKGIL